MKYIIAVLVVFGAYWYWNQSDVTTAYVPTPGATLSDAEKIYYIQVFDYTMGNMKDGKEFEWESTYGKGQLTPLTTYISKSRATCRHYKEEFVIGEKPGTNEGVTCKRDGKDGWCRLKTGNAETCAMERAETDVILGNIGVGNLNIGTVSIGGVEVELPKVESPTIGSVETPDGPKETPSLLPKFEKRKQGQTSADWLINR